MTNLERDVASATGEPVGFPEDVALLKREIPELSSLSDAVVAHIYSEWSEDNYCAGWLILDYGLAEFAEYLRAPIDTPIKAVPPP